MTQSGEKAFPGQKKSIGCSSWACPSLAKGTGAAFPGTLSFPVPLHRQAETNKMVLFNTVGTCQHVLCLLQVLMESRHGSKLAEISHAGGSSLENTVSFVSLLAHAAAHAKREQCDIGHRTALMSVS